MENWQGRYCLCLSEATVRRLWECMSWWHKLVEKFKVQWYGAAGIDTALQFEWKRFYRVRPNAGTSVSVCVVAGTLVLEACWRKADTSKANSSPGMSPHTECLGLLVHTPKTLCAQHGWILSALSKHSDELTPLYLETNTSWFWFDARQIHGTSPLRVWPPFERRLATRFQLILDRVMREALVENGVTWAGWLNL